MSSGLDHRVRVELTIGGMTCGSCAARVERKLNKLDGVQATVNYATAKASVLVPPGLPVEHVVGAVEASGYTARLPERTAPPATERPLVRLVGCAVLTIPVLVVSNSLRLANFRATNS